MVDFGDDDFGSDFGESDFGSDDFSSSFGSDDFGGGNFSGGNFSSSEFGDNSPTSNNTDKDNSDTFNGISEDTPVNNKKTIVLVLGAGALLILGSLFVSTKIKQYKVYMDQKAYQEQYNNYTNIDNTNSGVSNSQNNSQNNVIVDGNKELDNGGNVIDINSSNYNDAIDIVSKPVNWVPFSVKYYGEPSSYMESIFVVKKINGYLLNNRGMGLNQTKYTVSGNLDNIDGVYDIEVNYDIANKLEVGTEFKVWVRTISIGEEKIISEIVTKNPN